MDAERAEELDLKEDQKTEKLANKIISLDTIGSEHVGRLLFPEIPWLSKVEDRGCLDPTVLPTWLVLPFYEKPILVIHPLKKDHFKMRYGLTSEDVHELLTKRRIYATIRFDHKDFVGEEFNHLDCILESGLPHARWIFLIEAAFKKKTKEKWEEEFDKLRQEAVDLDPEFAKFWNAYYAVLSILGLEGRLKYGIRSLSILQKLVQEDYHQTGAARTARHLKSLRWYRTHWLDLIFWNFISPYFYGAVPVCSNTSHQLLSEVFGFPIKPEQGVVHEVAQELLVNIGFVSAANSNDLDLDLVIRTQDHTKDFRKAYNEFMSLVSELKLKEALETRDAIGYASEELKKSSPILDRTENIIHTTLTVSVAAMTAQALNLLLSSGLISLIPGGISGATALQALRNEKVREWLEGKYARLLHRLGVGPFAFAHTWRAQKIVKRRKLL